jgi:uncharacterized protein
VTNPSTCKKEAIESSSYCGWEDGRLVRKDGGEPASRMAQEVHGALRALLHDPDFPCVGAKSIVNQASYRFGLYKRLAESDDTAALARDLSRFIGERPAIEGEFSSFIACFQEPKVKTPKEFEGLLWRQLLALHDLDAPLDWNAGASRDVNDARFGFSFGGHAFFVVGLSPAGERWARSFPWPTLVFNDHAQFERLRREERFDRMKEVIRERDEKLNGEPNAMLSDFGAHSEARQYAGRKVGPKWRCPVDFSA